jgi:hypothetical protein
VLAVAAALIKSGRARCVDEKKTAWMLRSLLA